jgi:hypothetical protein
VSGRNLVIVKPEDFTVTEAFGTSFGKNNSGKKCQNQLTKTVGGGGILNMSKYGQIER